VSQVNEAPSLLAHFTKLKKPHQNKRKKYVLNARNRHPRGKQTKEQINNMRMR